MKVFVDANVLINVLNKEYPAYDASARFLGLAQSQRFQFFTSSLSLAITWFFAEKKSGRALARKKIALLLEHIHISDCGENEVLQALNEKKADDFEDALQVFSALESNCVCIVTNNISDFHFSKLEVLSPLDFLMRKAQAV